ncbi:hypothetical protein [Allosphingosinicella deserti]|uniref:Uncharacterized protein n=1 Tax=Allosphingosinicella deserti TaxID=2116704 RepID=A0A2P7QYJ9_9SPHN|nr:hypothetical protein [Sphingomonas deserti]PSJ43023.1 hypothetical protein C7I55_01045 [Sphingomonas deserti]
MVDIHLGDEWDEDLIAAIDAVLQGIGAERISKHGSIAGSQEWSSSEWRLGEQVITVERETYMGVSLVGPPALTNAVAAAALARCGRAPL